MRRTSLLDRLDTENRWAGGGIRVLFCALVLGSLSPLPVASETTRYDEEQRVALTGYRDCLVNTVQPAQSAVASTYLQQACQRVFAPDQGGTQAKNGTQRLTVPEKQQTEKEINRPFDDCLLRYLPTVHNDQSAHAMVQLCREQFGPVAMEGSPGNKPSKILQLLGITPDRKNREHPDMTIEGDSFVPLVPWQSGQPHTRESDP